MKDWYKNLKIEYQVSLWSAIVIVGLFILCIPFYFFSLMEIPQGILLGGEISILIYLFLGLFNNPEKPKKSLVVTFVVIAIRLLVIGGILFLVGWLYYRMNVKAFNIFAVAGSYLVPIVIHLILARKGQE